jgi:hypothetical protein
MMVALAAVDLNGIPASSRMSVAVVFHGWLACWLRRISGLRQWLSLQTDFVFYFFLRYTGITIASVITD